MSACDRAGTRNFYHWCYDTRVKLRSYEVLMNMNKCISFNTVAVWSVAGNMSCYFMWRVSPTRRITNCLQANHLKTFYSLFMDKKENAYGAFPRIYQANSLYPLFIQDEYKRISATTVFAIMLSSICSTDVSEFRPFLSSLFNMFFHLILTLYFWIWSAMLIHYLSFWKLLSR